MNLNDAASFISNTLEQDPPSVDLVGVMAIPINAVVTTSKKTPGSSTSLEETVPAEQENQVSRELFELCATSSTDSGSKGSSVTSSSGKESAKVTVKNQVSRQLFETPKNICLKGASENVSDSKKSHEK